MGDERREKIPRDWSLTVWAEDGPVKVTKEKGDKPLETVPTDIWPFIAR